MVVARGIRPTEQLGVGSVGKAAAAPVSILGSWVGVLLVKSILWLSKARNGITTWVGIAGPAVAKGEMKKKDGMLHEGGAVRKAVCGQLIHHIPPSLPSALSPLWPVY